MTSLDDFKRLMKDNNISATHQGYCESVIKYGFEHLECNNVEYILENYDNFFDKVTKVRSLKSLSSKLSGFLRTLEKLERFKGYVTDEMFKKHAGFRGKRGEILKKSKDVGESNSILAVGESILADDVESDMTDESVSIVNDEIAQNMCDMFDTLSKMRVEVTEMATANMRMRNELSVCKRMLGYILSKDNINISGELFGDILTMM
jgi:hypothetical protein